jgi:Flp pilus assembly protein TadG
MNRSIRTLRESERGQAVVELALVLPILLLILVGIVELGRAVNNWNNDTNLANVVARYAIVGKKPSSTACPGEQTAETFVACEAKNEGLGSTKVCIKAPAGAKAGEPLEVKVESKYKWLSYLHFKATEATLTGHATMRLEQVPPEVTC